MGSVYCSLIKVSKKLSYAIFASSDLYVLCHVCLFKSSINASTDSLLDFLIVLYFKEFNLFGLLLVRENIGK